MHRHAGERSIFISTVFSNVPERLQPMLSNAMAPLNLARSMRKKFFGVDGVAKLERLEADEINCDGFIKAEEEVSADIMHVDGCIHAKEIVGDHISINSRSGKIAGLLARKTSSIKLVEATTVKLRGVTAQKGERKGYCDRPPLQDQKYRLQRNSSLG